MMTHDEVGQLAAERYLLHDMPETERDAFEDHYFGCLVCANEVRRVYAFHDAVRAAALRDKDDDNGWSRAALRRWRNYVTPLAAAASLAVGALGMQYEAVRPMQLAMKQPMVITQTIRLPLNRGPENPEETTIHNSGEAFELDAQIAEDGRKTPYTCTVVDARGAVRRSVTITPDEASLEFVRIGFPGHALKPGAYSLRIDTKPITELPFTVR